MRIVLRVQKNSKPAMEIKRVDYFEPLPDRMRFTAAGFEGVQEVEYLKGDFIWQDVRYGFLELFDN